MYSPLLSAAHGNIKLQINGFICNSIRVPHLFFKVTVYLTDAFNSTDVAKQKHKEIREWPIYHKVLSPPAGVAKLTVGALGPAAGVDVSNPGKIDP